MYHLKDPVRHLRELGKYIRVGIMLDTHYALDHEATDSYEVNGDSYPYKRYQESGYSDPFSGMYDHAKWLKLDDIIKLLKDTGFTNVEVVEKRKERYGHRVLLFAQRPTPFQRQEEK